METLYQYKEIIEEKELNKINCFLGTKGYDPDLLTKFILKLFTDKTIWNLHVDGIYIIKNKNYKIIEVKELDNRKFPSSTKIKSGEVGTGIFTVSSTSPKKGHELTPSFKEEYKLRKNLIDLTFPVQAKYYKTENLTVFCRNLS